MKKNSTLRILTAVMAIAVCMTAVGCGNDTPDRDIVIGGNSSSTDDTENNSSDKGFAFIHNNVTITPNDLVDPLVKALGSDYTYHESASCAYIGLDKMYVYDSFVIYTYPDDKAVDHVLQLMITDDSLSTPEGLRLGDTSAKVIELYGSDYEEANSAYAYTRGKTSLIIIMKNDHVTSIQYTYVES